MYQTGQVYLLLIFDGSMRSNIDDAFEGVAGICLDTGVRDVLISDTEERHESIWSACGAFLEAIKSSTPEKDECNVFVPPYQIVHFVRFVKEL